MNNLLRFQRVAEISDEVPAKFREAALYSADDGLRSAIELALELSQPLLLTGEPGCGKTVAAYWAAWYLGLDASDVFHSQIRSNSSAEQLKYEFDNIGYLRESQVAATLGTRWTPSEMEQVRRRCVRPGALWRAFEAAQTRSVVLLLDEIDKAPRDFPNDLLHEFDQLEFDVPEWVENGEALKIGARPKQPLPDPPPFILILLTSNGERRLPDAFLRRCVHHHLAFDNRRMLEIVQYRKQKGQEIATLTDEFVKLALGRFVVLRSQPDLNHRPGMAEFLIWLRVLAKAGNIDVNRLEALPVGELPYLGLLLKDPEDRKRAETVPR